MFIVFLCEEIVCFNEKCVVKQLAMETTFSFGVSVGLGEEPGCRGTFCCGCWRGAARHQHPGPPLGRGRCQRRGRGVPGKLQAASTAPQEKCHGGKSSLNPAWHSLCSGGALALSWTRPAARVGRARLAAAGVPARPQAMARSAAAPR